MGRWTQEERVRVVLNIVGEMHEIADNGRLTQPRDLGVWADRIEMVLIWPTEFLEINRDSILHGFPFSPNRQL